MSKINLGRVILGGLVAGLIVNLLEFVLHEKVIKAAEMAAMTAIGKGGSTGQVWVWLVYGFAYGIVAVWIYAAIQPRFGAGAATAVRAAVIAWFLNTLLSGVALVNLGIYGANVTVITVLWGLVETVIAVIAGGRLYRDA
jgi:hypothetical protein